MFRVLKYVFGGSSLLVAGLFWLAYLSPRPPLTIDPATLAGDGSKINYCELPILDGIGLTAGAIPKGNTPGCGYSQFPLPVLRDCRSHKQVAGEDHHNLACQGPPWRKLASPSAHTNWCRDILISTCPLICVDRKHARTHA